VDWRYCEGSRVFPLPTFVCNMRRTFKLMAKPLSEAGQAMMGLTVSGSGTFKETFARHRPTMRINNKVRTIPPN
jgi:hypothetical protein